jgi:hypothetical protein
MDFFKEGGPSEVIIGDEVVAGEDLAKYFQRIRMKIYEAGGPSVFRFKDKEIHCTPESTIVDVERQCFGERYTSQKIYDAFVHREDVNSKAFEQMIKDMETEEGRQNIVEALERLKGYFSRTRN